MQTIRLQFHNITSSKPKLLATFISLSIIEAMYLFDVSSKMEDIAIPGVDVEVSHVIFLMALTLFGIGIFRVSK